MARPKGSKNKVKSNHSKTPKTDRNVPTFEEINKSYSLGWLDGVQEVLAAFKASRVHLDFEMDIDTTHHIG